MIVATSTNYLFQYPVGHSGVRTVRAIARELESDNVSIPCRAFGGSDLITALDWEWPHRKVSIPCRAFGGSDASLGDVRSGQESRFQYPVGHSGVRTVPGASRPSRRARVSIPCRAFGGSDKGHRPMNCARDFVSIPCRAFGGSDLLGSPCRRSWLTASFNTLSGIRGFGPNLFLETDGSVNDLRFNTLSGIRGFGPPALAQGWCAIFWALPVRLCASLP